MKTNLKNTRKVILEAVYKDMKIHGFQACRPDKVIKDLPITKGALYYYFPNKLLLGYAVVDEIVGPKYLEFWKPLENYQGDVLNYLLDQVKNIQKFFGKQETLVGSPLSNLIQEMSPVDDGFRKRLENIVNNIKGIIIEAIRRSRKKGLTVEDIDPESFANFYLSAIEGSYNLAKVSNDKKSFTRSLDCLINYLEKLKR